MRDPGEGGDAWVQHVLKQLRDPNGPDVIRIGVIPSAALDHWSNRVTDEVVITRRQRDHYLEQHPEMFDLEFDLVRTLLDPDEVQTAKRGGATAILFARQDASHDIVAVVSISEHSELRNSVITARRQRSTRKVRPANAKRKVWRK